MELQECILPSIETGLEFLFSANPRLQMLAVTAVEPIAVRVQLGFYSLYIQGACAPSGQRMRGGTSERCAVFFADAAWACMCAVGFFVCWFFLYGKGNEEKAIHAQTW